MSRLLVLLLLLQVVVRSSSSLESSVPTYTNVVTPSYSDPEGQCIGVGTCEAENRLRGSGVNTTATSGVLVPAWDGGVVVVRGLLLLLLLLAGALVVSPSDSNTVPL
jgi:hypothetical protein